MSFSWLSIMGMYEHDPTVMDGLRVPEGMDKETVVNNILLNCAELEVIYSHIDSMRLAIKVWSDSNQIGWKKLYETMTIEYNPIWNVDANIYDTENIDSKRDIGRSGNDTKAVQGFNSSSWANAEKIDHSENVDDDNVVSREYTQRRTGNIGVTTTQQMLEQERAIADFNMVEYITESFKKRFCLMIY